MKYRFFLSYASTAGATAGPRTCFPLHSDDLAVSIAREDDEWFYTRSLEGKLVFTNDDYAWIMARPFDGTFTLTVRDDHDGSGSWFDYFSATFSRANLEIDEDNRTATLSGLKEGITDLIRNGKDTDYDLMKLIPDSECKEVQGQVPPALAMVDECSEFMGVTFSDIYCNTPFVSGGYNSDTEMFWAVDKDMRTNPRGTLQGILAEAEVIMDTPSLTANGKYAGTVNYDTLHRHDTPTQIGFDFYITSLVGYLNESSSRYRIQLSLEYNPLDQIPYAYLVASVEIPGQQNPDTARVNIGEMLQGNKFYSPLSITLTGSGSSRIETITIKFHYIYSFLLLNSTNAIIRRKNILVTSDYYKYMEKFVGGGLDIFVSVRTSEQPNGYRMVPGSDENSGIPQYYAPPFDDPDFIPLAQDNWDKASFWYMITPTVANGLTNPAKFGSFAWTRCWSIGTCIQFLLKRITGDKVVFAESTDYSQFLYANPNPVADGEPFQWLVTQKTNVSRGTQESAARCIVRLQWFLELLRNAFNCYYWMEKRDDGRYDFRIEHVEYFRRGGAYNGQLADQLDLTRLKPVRNFLRNGQPAKRYADQTNRYTFDLDGMAEKYTFSWQGEGGSDDFRGNPMYFRAGWIDQGKVEDRQVDNIFADLNWLMLNAGTDTASSKNYDGLFLFGGYRMASLDGTWDENKPPQAQMLNLAYQSTMIYTAIYLYLTAPEGHTITLQLHHNVPSQQTQTIATYTGTGAVQCIPIVYESAFIVPHDLALNFGSDYADVIIHRIHAIEGNIFLVPNIENLLLAGNYLQNGTLAWPWLQREYLHYDIPAANWTYLKDDYTDGQAVDWFDNGTIKMVKKQSLALVPVPEAGTELDIMGIMAVRTGLGTGIIDSATVNLSSRNATMEIIYDINSNNNQ